MFWKKLGKALLFPHLAIMITLIPIAAVFLTGAMLFFDTESPVAITSYVVAAYTLTIWCFRIPRLIRWIKTVKNENKFAVLLLNDARLRVNISLYGSLAWNALYGIFQLWLGLYHGTFWFASFGAYYICLGVMRFFLARHSTKFAPGKRMRDELVKYRACGWVLLFMNLALALIVFFMVYWNRTFEHHMITAIAMAAFTFTSFTVAVVNVIKYRKYNSPVFSASKLISFAAALVSMLTLESTMLTAFSDGTMSMTDQKMMLGATGGGVCALIVAIAVYMIVVGTKKLRKLKTEVNNGEQQ